MGNKSKITDKWDCIKQKAKETVNRVKRWLTKQEKCLCHYSSERGLITQIYKELKQLSVKKASKAIRKWENEWDRHLSKEEI
jgi:hypothetical protein